MLSPCLIWLETGQRVVLDGGVGVGFLPAAMAAGVLRAGVMEGGGEVVEELQGEMEKLGVEAIGVEEGWREVSHGEQSGGG
jgi:protein-L-isoaspartate O-methyltransferase